MNKQDFILQKLNNFSLFVEKELGKDNEVYKDLQLYLSNLNVFIQNLIRLSAIASTKDGKKIFVLEDINKYLEYKNITKKVDKTICEKLMRYLNMFLDILNS